MKVYKFLLGILFTSLVLSCEDVVDVKLNEAPPIVVIDAWVNDLNTEQQIRLTRSQTYFDNTAAQGIAGATVRILNSSDQAIIFTSTSEEGTYTWNPSSDPSFFGTIGERYMLEVILSSGEVYSAQSQINRVPEVDSIKFTFKEKTAFQDAGYEGEFLATDFIGTGDTYWIKAYKNGQFLNKPFELNTAYDAGFSAGGNVDGVVFIQPIQSRVQELDKDLRTIPYQLGDSLYVEIHSITNKAYDFMEQVKIQTQRNGGFGEIFAEPFENVKTNIRPNDPNEKVAGFFNVASVSSRGKKLIE